MSLEWVKKHIPEYKHMEVSSIYTRKTSRGCDLYFIVKNKENIEDLYSFDWNQHTEKLYDKGFNEVFIADTMSFTLNNSGCSGSGSGWKLVFMLS
jgi:hypothetical protein